MLQIRERLQEVPHEEQTWQMCHQLAVDFDVPYDEVRLRQGVVWWLICACSALLAQPQHRQCIKWQTCTTHCGPIDSARKQWP